MAEPTDSTKRTSTGDNIAETFQMVKDYARQETVDPLRNAGRWIAFGLVGSILIGLATAFLSLGLLRMVQHEFPGTFGGRWSSLAPYAFALGMCVLVAGIAFSRINKKPLDKEQR